jgi:SpoVK/Ycf46/Vps4 family AAA+-type ATPase
MVYERFYGPGGNFLAWRCIQCGEIIDEVILENRQTGEGRSQAEMGKKERMLYLMIAMIEILPSMLMTDGVEKFGANLHAIMEKVRTLEDAVIFIDEFDEIAGSRDKATLVDKSITNEFLKQVPLLKNQGNKILLVCATNYIRQLDAALLRPGRFDCIIPVGDLDEDGRKTILEYYLSRLNTKGIDLDRIVGMTSRFTPADIEYLFQQVAQFAFEEEYASKHDYVVTTDTFLQMIARVRPSLTEGMIEDFKKDSFAYART